MDAFLLTRHQVNAEAAQAEKVEGGIVVLQHGAAAAASAALVVRSTEF
jgi:hypothetical protein